MRRFGSFVIAAVLFSGMLCDTAGASTSPLVNVAPDASLNCTTGSTRSDWLQFFSSGAVTPRALSCGTLVAVDGVGLFGPLNFGDSSGKVAGTPLLQVTPVRQTSISPRHSHDGALHVETVVKLGDTGLEVRERDTYRPGRETMTTAIAVENTGTHRRKVVVYRTGDCFPGSDVGFAIVGNGAAGCEQAVQDGFVARPEPGPLYMRFSPTRGKSRFMAGGVFDVRAAIGSRLPLPDSCDCATAQDVAAALSWTLRIAPGAHAGVAQRLTLSRVAGRRATKLTAQVVGPAGRRRMVARLTAGHRALRHAAVTFEINEVAACSAATSKRGLASCPWPYSQPDFVARYRGDAWHQPARATFLSTGTVPVPHPPGFPACAHFDRTRTALISGGDGHFEWIAAPTDAPPCPNVNYVAWQRGGGEVAELLGDGRTTTLVGEVVPGFVGMFVTTPLGAVTDGCIYLTATDTRTGEQLDTYPAPTDSPPCLSAVAGQKFR
jgi:hypothetical protein